VHGRRGEFLRNYATIWLDAPQAVEQLAGVQRLFPENLGHEVRVLREVKLPLTDLLTRVRSALDTRIGRRSQWLAGGYFEPPQEGVVDLVLYGPFFPDDKGEDGKTATEKVQQWCTELIATDVSWDLDAPFRVVPVDRKMERLSLPKLDPAAGQPGAAPATKARAIKETALAAQDKIRKAVMEDPRLNGVWVELSPFYHVDEFGQDRLFHYDVVLWLDPEQADFQRSAAETLLKANLDADFRIVEEVPLPLSSLADKLQQAMEGEPGFGKGCWVLGAHYQDDNPIDDSVDIVPYGRMFESGEEVRVLQKCQELIAADPAFRLLGPRRLIPVDRKLKLLASPEAGVAASSEVGVAAVRQRLFRQRRDIREELKNDPELHGVWIELAPCFDQLEELDHYDVHLWYDRSRSVAQQVKMASRLDGLGVQYEIVQETMLPFSELVEDLQRRIQEIYGRGCHVSNAYYYQQPEAREMVSQTRPVELVLYGRVWNDDMKIRIEDECRILMRRDAVWQDLAPGIAGKEGDRLALTDRMLGPHELSDASRDLRKKIRAQLASNPRLHGAWIDLAECRGLDGGVEHYEVYLWLDPSQLRKGAKSEVTEQLPAEDETEGLGEEAQRPFGSGAVDGPSAAKPGVTAQFVSARRRSRSSVRCPCLVHQYPATAAAPDGDGEAEPPEEAAQPTLAPPKESVPTGARQEFRPPDQREEVLKVLDRFVGEGRYVVVKEVYPPLSEFLDELRSRVEKKFGKGCYVRGGYYQDASEAAPGPGGGTSIVELVLYGRIFEEWQRTRIQEMANEVLQGAPEFDRLIGPGSDPKLVVVDRKFYLYDPTEYENELNRVRQAIAGDERLRGVWVDLASCKDHEGQLDHHEVYLWLNAAYTREPEEEPEMELETEPVEEPKLETRRCVWTDACGCPHLVEYQVAVTREQQPGPQAAPSALPPALPSVDPDEQRLLVQGILDKCLGADRHVTVDEVTLPLSELIAQLQKRIKDLYGPGCYLSGAEFVKPEASPPSPAEESVQPGTPEQALVELALQGRVFDEAQRVRIMDECKRLMGTNSIWERENLPGPRGSRLVVVDRQLRDDSLLPESREKLAAIRQILFNDPGLHGSWVDLAECRNRQNDVASYDVCVWLDTQKAQTQRKVVMDALDRWLGQGNYRIAKQAELPLSSLVAQLKQRFEPLSGPGSYVSGAFYGQRPEASGRTVEIVLYGRVLDDRTRELVVNDCDRLKKTDPAWNQVVSLRGDKLVVVDRELRTYERSAETTEKLRQIYQSLFQRPELRGVWVGLNERFDHRNRLTGYEVYIQRDQQDGKQQREKVLDVLNRRLGEGYKIAREDHLPVSDLLWNVNLAMDSTHSMDGCLVQGIHFSLPSGPGAGVLDRILSVDGRIADEEQMPRISETVDAYLQRDPRWRRCIEHLEMDLGGMKVVRMDGIRGTKLFDVGMQHFWRGRYQDASRAFRLAVTDAPSSDEYRYWRVLAEMQQGSDTRAYQAMVAATMRQPSYKDIRRIYRSLERIQGPTRVALVNLENRARTEFHLAFNQR
jgi:hypothetical protein